MPAVLACTSGTAAANYAPAVIEAHEARVPLIVLTADRPWELRDTGAGQTIDQVKLYGRAAKWFLEVDEAPATPERMAYMRKLACRAFATSVGDRPGPVHLNFSLREPLILDTKLPKEPGTRGRPGGAPWVVHFPAPSRPKVHTQARYPLLVAGDGADGEALAVFAAQAKWPLLADPLSGASDDPTATAGARGGRGADRGGQRRGAARARPGRAAADRRARVVLNLDNDDPDHADHVDAARAEALLTGRSAASTRATYAGSRGSCGTREGAAGRGPAAAAALPRAGAAGRARSDGARRARGPEVAAPAPWPTWWPHPRPARRRAPPPRSCCGPCGRAPAGRPGCVAGRVGGGTARRAHRDLDSICALFDTAARAEETRTGSAPASSWRRWSPSRSPPTPWPSAAPAARPCGC